MKIYSVITGHGSDENFCAEFCITSHHFVVNQKHLYNETFFNAGKESTACNEQTIERLFLSVISFQLRLLSMAMYNKCITFELFLHALNAGYANVLTTSFKSFREPSTFHLSTQVPPSGARSRPDRESNPTSMARGCTAGTVGATVERSTRG